MGDDGRPAREHDYIGGAVDVLRPSLYLPHGMCVIYHIIFSDDLWDQKQLSCQITRHTGNATRKFISRIDR